MTNYDATRVILKNNQGKYLIPYVDKVEKDWNGNVIADTYLKRDVSSNITTSGKSFVAGLSMPSEKFTTLSVGAAGSTYTAPANGWFRAAGTSNANFAYLAIVSNSGQANEFSLEQGTVYQVGNGMVTSCPVTKGQTVTLNYHQTSIASFKFFYAEGDAPTESEV